MSYLLNYSLPEVNDIEKCYNSLIPPSQSMFTVKSNTLPKNQMVSLPIITEKNNKKDEKIIIINRILEQNEKILEQNVEILKLLKEE